VNRERTSTLSSHPTGLARQINRALLGATLAFSGLALLVLLALAPELRDRAAALAALTYGASLVACSLFSFLYNVLERARRRQLLRYLDHAAIFLLIAGTYTPFAAVALPPGRAGLLLGIVWSLALLGMALKLRFRGPGYDRLFVPFYLAIGWMFVVAADELFRALDLSTLSLLAVGGAAYTVGALIYARDIGRWTDPIWHALVLVGAATHFLAVVAVLPA
jgi:hemolysin III